MSLDYPGVLNPITRVFKNTEMSLAEVTEVQQKGKAADR